MRVDGFSLCRISSNSAAVQSNKLERRAETISLYFCPFRNWMIHILEPELDKATLSLCLLHIEVPIDEHSPSEKLDFSVIQGFANANEVDQVAGHAWWSDTMHAWKDLQLCSLTCVNVSDAIWCTQCIIVSFLGGIIHAPGMPLQAKAYHSPSSCGASTEIAKILHEFANVHHKRQLWRKTWTSLW